MSGLTAANRMEPVSGFEPLTVRLPTHQQLEARHRHRHRPRHPTLKPARQESRPRSRPAADDLYQSQPNPPEHGKGMRPWH